MSFKYPWEQDIEEFEASADREPKDQVVQKNWKSVARTGVDEIGKYGLEYLIYFQTIRSLCGIFLLSSLLAAPKIAYCLTGDALVQLLKDDPLAWLARPSLGNADAAGPLVMGDLEVHVGFRQSYVLGLLDALQMVLTLLLLLWLGLHTIPRLAQHPDVSLHSASRFAVEVAGLPSRLPTIDRHRRYDYELVRHFEAVLRELRGGDPNALVCEVAVVRHFGSALLVAQRRERAQAHLQRLQEMAPSAETAAVRLRIEALTREMAGLQVAEADRSVQRAFVIVNTAEERRLLLREFRLARLPLLGRCLQPARLRFDARWPLALRPAPEPGDLVWAHMTLPLSRRWRCRALAGTALVTLVLLCLGLSLFVWWLFLGVRGAAASQCGPGSPTDDWGPAPCLGSSSNITARGCDCFCASPERRHTEAGECHGLGSVRALTAVLICTLSAEIFHWLLNRVTPTLVARCRCALASERERLTVATLSTVQCLVPLGASAALVAYKALLSRGLITIPLGLGEPLLWELDKGWYLHGAPVVVLWCLVRWCAPLAFALGVRCGYMRQGRRMLLWERYQSLLTVVSVSIMLQALLPIMTPLGAYGLFVRYWSEKYVFFHGHMVLRSGTPVSVAVSLARSALCFLWLAVAVGALLAVWVHGHPSIAGSGPTGPWRVQGPAIPPFVVLCVAVAAPAVVSAVSGVLWLLGLGFDSRAGQSLGAASASAAKAGAAAGGGAGKRAGGEQGASFQEEWLMMRHSGVLASYLLQENPEYKGNTVLQELQPGAERRSGSPSNAALATGPSAAAYLSRSLDMMPSLERIGDRAPSRHAGKGKGKGSAGATTAARKKPQPKDQESEWEPPPPVTPPFLVENATVMA